MITTNPKVGNDHARDSEGRKENVATELDANADANADADASVNAKASHHRDFSD